MSVLFEWSNIILYAHIFDIMKILIFKTKAVVKDPCEEKNTFDLNSLKEYYLSLNHLDEES